MQHIFILDTSKDEFGGLKNDGYLRILELCFSRATSFSIERMNFRPSYPNAVEDMLEPYLIRTYNVNRWFGYGIGGEHIELLYQANHDTMNILMHCFSDIFFRNTRKIPKKKYEQIGKEFLYPSTLENICFFKNTELFLGTVSHEYFCAVKYIDEVFENAITDIGSWNESINDDFGLNRRYI